MYVIDNERRNPIGLGYRVKGQSQIWHSYLQEIVGMIQTTVLAQSLSNIVHKLWLMRRGTLLI